MKDNLLQETTKLILEAIHECSYEEALKREYEQYRIKFDEWAYRFRLHKQHEYDELWEYYGCEKVLPITLSRVLQAIRNTHSCVYKSDMDFLYWEELGAKVRMDKKGRYDYRRQQVVGRTFLVSFEHSKTIEVCDPDESYSYEKEVFNKLNDLFLINKINFIVYIWKLLKENKETATLEDQSEKTIQSIYDLFNNN